MAHNQLAHTESMRCKAKRGNPRSLSNGAAPPAAQAPCKRRKLCSLGSGEFVHVMALEAKKGKVEEFESRVQDMARCLYSLTSGVSDVRVCHPCCGRVLYVITFLDRCDMERFKQGTPSPHLCRAVVRTTDATPVWVGRLGCTGLVALAALGCSVCSPLSSNYFGDFEDRLPPLCKHSLVCAQRLRCFPGRSFCGRESEVTRMQAQLGGGGGGPCRACQSCLCS